MAFSPDVEQGRRIVNPEVSSSFPSSRVIFERDLRDPSLSQAFNMGLVSKVDITPEEAALYKRLRERPLDENGSLKSDQVLMAEDVLIGEKSAQFKRAFPQSFPPLQ